MCELSVKGTEKHRDAAGFSPFISQISVENVIFNHHVRVGEVMSLKAKVLYVDSKKGLAFVQVMIRAIDLTTGKYTTHGVDESDSYDN